jgi:ParB-like nuclease family protein/DNA methylase
MNKKIYGSLTDSDLVESIFKNGVLEPIVITSGRRVVSGHRRLAAAKQLGLKTIPARMEKFDDEVLALIEFNRQRIKTWSERYHELQIILPKLRADAADRRAAGAKRGAARRHGLPETHLGHRHGHARVYDEAAMMTGLSREKIRKLIRIHEAIRSNSASESIAVKLDTGGLTVHQAYLAIKRVKNDETRRDQLALDTAEGRYNLDDLIKPFDIWSFPKRDRRFDLALDQHAGESAGSPPPQIWINLIHLLTEEGDLVVDLMAGSGTAGRVAEWMQRRCASFDIAPRGGNVRRHDMTKGFPRVSGPPRLIILDPPYYTQKSYSRAKNDLSKSKTLSQYLGALGKMISVSMSVLPKDGHLAVVMGNGHTDSEFHDLGFETAKLIEKHARLVRRIAVPYSTQQHQGHVVAKAKNKKRLLSLTRELMIACPR